MAAQELAFSILVVDQSPQEDAELARRAAAWPALTVVRDSGTGLSRARNIAWRRLHAEWIAFVDDDCLVQPGWAAALSEEIEHHPEASFISGWIGEQGALAGDDYAAIATHEIDRPRTVQGTRVLPWQIGLGVHAVRRSAVDQLQGWDERLGAGCPRFPAADDMDFNYRLLRSGATAFVTPRVRVVHDQWRTASELPAMYENYMIGWSGFAMKHLRSGNAAGGLRLWAWGVYDLYRMAGSSIRRRSRWRALVAAHKLRGLVKGTYRGLREVW
jgi:GT2 family glycosyltransferase